MLLFFFLKKKWLYFSSKFRIKIAPQSFCSRHETQVQSPGWEDPLKKGMATRSSILAWRIPWTEKPGGLWCIGSRRVRHNWSDSTHVRAHTHTHCSFFNQLPSFLSLPNSDSTCRFSSNTSPPGGLLWIYTYSCGPLLLCWRWPLSTPPSQRTFSTPILLWLSDHAFSIIQPSNCNELHSYPKIPSQVVFEPSPQSYKAKQRG